MAVYIALVAVSETTFQAAHKRRDLNVFAYEILHTEGSFPTARVDIRNPSPEGLLASSRLHWCWISEDDGGGNATPLFFGRLIGIPQDLQNDVVRLEFIGRPSDWDEQRAALAAELKTDPLYYDPAFVPEEQRDDPDTALEARSARWHIDRVTHEVTISDVVNGEDGTLNLQGDFFRDSLSLSYGQVPARRVEVIADVYWQQQAAGSVNLTQELLDEAATKGSLRDGHIETYTGEGLALDWPKEGDSIGGGWTVGISHVLRGEGIWIPQEEIEVSGYGTFPLLNGGTANLWFEVGFPLWSFRPVFNVKYEVDRSFQERLRFTLNADVQPLLTEPGDDEVVRVAMASHELNELIDPADDTGGQDQAPIRDVRRRAYFPTDRGRQSLEYLIAVARATLLARSRAVQISFDTLYETVAILSCRMNVRIESQRLPGGEATGKVIGYSLTYDADSGTRIGTVTIGCMIGQGNVVTETLGTPNYVDEGYFNPGQGQTYTGAVVMPIPGEVTYDADDLDIEPGDDGLDFLQGLVPADIIEPNTEYDGVEMLYGRAEQEDIINGLSEGQILDWVDPKSVIAALDLAFTEIRVNLKPLDKGPYLTTYDLTVSDLMIPRGIDLEAAL